MARVMLDPNHPPRLSADELLALDALTSEEVEENARTDPDNPPLTEQELERVRLARLVQLTRQSSGLTQAEFAQRYDIDPQRLDGWERGTIKPDGMIMAYLKTIRHEPEAVRRALAASAAA